MAVMIMTARKDVHLLLRGRRYRRGVKGQPRGRHLHVMVSPPLQLALMSEAARNRATVGVVVEQLLWKGLGQLAAWKGARLQERLRHASALIDEVVASAFTVQIAGDVRVPGQAGVVDVHGKEARQQRRNELSQKAKAAFDEIYDLAQTEALAAENQKRATMYMILARLAEVNEALLKGASEEEILHEIERLREDQERFEEATRKLEEESKEPATTK